MRHLILSAVPDLADKYFMIFFTKPRRTIPCPKLFVPTWIFPEEFILGSLAGLNDDLLQTVDLGRFFVSLKERELEEMQLRQ